MRILVFFAIMIGIGWISLPIAEWIIDKAFLILTFLAIVHLVGYFLFGDWWRIVVTVWYPRRRTQR